MISISKVQLIFIYSVGLAFSPARVHWQCDACNWSKVPPRLRTTPVIGQSILQDHGQPSASLGLFGATAKLNILKTFHYASRCHLPPLELLWVRHCFGTIIYSYLTYNIDTRLCNLNTSTFLQDILYIYTNVRNLLNIKAIFWNNSAVRWKIS